MSVAFEQITLDASDGIAAKTVFSQVMCDTLAKQKPQRLLDIGCGSGILGLYSLLNGCQFVYFNDIQDQAIDLTQKNLNQHLLPATTYQLLSCPFQQINLSQLDVDVIVFNPPQLPTAMVAIKQFEQQSERVFRDGGHDGLALMTQFVTWLAQHLTDKQRAYMSFSSMLLVDDFLEKIKHGGLGLIATKKYQHQVPLRDCFYPAVTQMSMAQRQRRELTQQKQQWYKKIYSIEFVKALYS